ncbi:unnamed protein product, partial [Amoebophrya sp. A120]
WRKELHPVDGATGGNGGTGFLSKDSKKNKKSGNGNYWGYNYHQDEDEAVEGTSNFKLEQERQRREARNFKDLEDFGDVRCRDLAKEYLLELNAVKKVKLTLKELSQRSCVEKILNPGVSRTIEEPLEYLFYYPPETTTTPGDELDYESEYSENFYGKEATGGDHYNRDTATRAEPGASRSYHAFHKDLTTKPKRYVVVTTTCPMFFGKYLGFDPLSASLPEQIFTPNGYDKHFAKAKEKEILRAKEESEKQLEKMWRKQERVSSVAEVAVRTSTREEEDHQAAASSTQRTGSSTTGVGPGTIVNDGTATKKTTKTGFVSDSLTHDPLQTQAKTLVSRLEDLTTDLQVDVKTSKTAAGPEAGPAVAASTISRKQKRELELEKMRKKHVGKDEWKNYLDENGKYDWRLDENYWR